MVVILRNELIKKLKKEMVISVKDATEVIGNRQGVYRLADQGDIVQVHPEGLGFFCLPETEEGEAHFAIISKYYSKCVISGPTALSLYGLSDEYISKIDVDIPKTTNLKNNLLNVHRVSPKVIDGVEARDFKDKGVPFEVKIYNPQRVLHEAYKYYHLSDSFYRVLKRYRRYFLNVDKPAKQYDEIFKFDKKVGTIIVNFLKMSDVDE